MVGKHWVGFRHVKVGGGALGQRENRRKGMEAENQKSAQGPTSVQVVWKMRSKRRSDVKQSLKGRLMETSRA